MRGVLLLEGPFGGLMVSVPPLGLCLSYWGTEAVWYIDDHLGYPVFQCLIILDGIG